MTPSNKRSLAIAGFVVLVGLCAAAFFVGKHAGSRKASLPTAPVTSAPSESPSSSASVTPSAPPSASSNPPPSNPPPSSPPPSSPPPSSPIASAAAGSLGPAITLPAQTSVPLSTAGENPAVLVPTSCTITDGVATAAGTFDPDFYAESNVRVGDVVELYVYSSPGATDPNGTQLADLGSEHPVPVGRTGPWQVTVPIDSELGEAPTQCRVAVQATHAFMGAGNAGG